MHPRDQVRAPESEINRGPSEVDRGPLSSSEGPEVDRGPLTKGVSKGDPDHPRVPPWAEGPILFFVQVVLPDGLSVGLGTFDRLEGAVCRSEGPSIGMRGPSVGLSEGAPCRSV